MANFFLRPTFHGLVVALMIGLGFWALLALTRNRASLWPVLYVILFITIASSFVLGFGHNSWVQFWTAEDQLIEWATFWLALLAAGCAAAAAWCARPRSAGLLSIVLTAMAVVFAGEEISWGQRKFGIKLPEALADYNSQNEMNIHNLEVMGFYLGNASQAVGPPLILFCFFLWQYVFRTASKAYTGLRFNPHVAVFSLLFAVYFFFSHYAYSMPRAFHTERLVVEDVPLADIPAEMFRLHSSSQAELSELLFAAFLLLAALALWQRFTAARPDRWAP